MIPLLLFLAFLCLVAGLGFIVFIQKPRPTPQRFTTQLPIFTSTDPDANFLQNKVTRFKANDYANTARVQRAAAEEMTALNEIYENAISKEKVVELQREKSVLELENQKLILERANAFGVTSVVYSSIMEKLYTGKIERFLDREETKDTIQVALMVTDRHFQKAKQLRAHILDLRLELAEMRTKELPEPILAAQVEDLENNIAICKKQLEEHIEKAIVSPIDGQEIG